jgi:hypothetical protein
MRLRTTVLVGFASDVDSVAACSLRPRRAIPGCCRRPHRRHCCSRWGPTGC